MGGYPLAGFEVTIIGRFWVTAEEKETAEASQLPPLPALTLRVVAYPLKLLC
jgi:hypothetical protein